MTCLPASYLCLYACMYIKAVTWGLLCIASIKYIAVIMCRTVDITLVILSV